MISLYALTLFPLNPAGMSAQEWTAFQPYRVCVLRRAKKLARSDDPVSQLEAVAKSKCQRLYGLLKADIAMDTAGIAIDADDPKSAFFGYQPPAYLEIMEAALSTEFEKVVSKHRAKSK